MIRLFVTALLLAVSLATVKGNDSRELEILPADGETFQKAVFSFWLSENEKPVKAVIIHQHGCTNASPEKHPPITGDFHWQALARKHNCALLCPQYFVTGSCAEWNDPDSGSERALFTALDHFASASGHPELSEVPWVLWGHSGGSSWSSQMIVRHPERVVTALFRGGSSKQFGDPAFRGKFLTSARDIPLLFVWGKRESVPQSRHFVSWNPMNTMFRELRSQGGKVTRLIDPDSEHGCDNSRLVVIPYFDAILAGKTQPGELMDIEKREKVELTADSLRDPSFTWLPNAEIAGIWKHFSETGKLPTHQSPQTAPVLHIDRGGENQIQLSWKVYPELVGGLRSYRIYRDGELWKEMGPKPGEAIATSRDATPESLRNSSITVSDAATYSVTFTDAAGNESPKSTRVRK
ncbi:MAG: hypothetical protein P1V20_13040 [Verrucomicrobiales bacterium]|nr:hypothetical protein [Verrucomicrobiales bacterium]